MSSHGGGVRAWWTEIVIRQAWLVPLALVLLVAPARADAPAPEWIDWRAAAGPSSCVDARAFASGLDRRLGDDAAKLARRIGLRLVLTIVPPSEGAPADAHWFGEILFVSERGEPLGKRTFDLAVSSCQEVVEALSLAATVYLKSAAVAPGADTNVVARAAPPALRAAPPAPVAMPAAPPAPAAMPAAPPALAALPAAPPALAALPAAPPAPLPPAPPASPRLPPSPASRRPSPTARAATPDRVAVGKPWALGAQGGALVELGDVPRGSRGFEVALLARPPVGPRLLLAASVLTGENVAADTGVGVDMRLFSARAGLCILEARWTARVLSVCPAFEVGQLWLDGIGLTAAPQQRRWRFAADVGVALTQRLYGPWNAGIEGRVTAPFVRNRITFDDSATGPTQVFRASIVGAVAEVTIGYMPNSK